MSTPNTTVRPASRFSARPAGYGDPGQPVALRSEEARAEFIVAGVVFGFELYLSRRE